MRDKLIEILYNGFYVSPKDELNGTVQKAADYLIAHGVTLATDNNVSDKWIPVSEGLPEDSGYYLVVYQDKYNGSISIAFDMYVKCKAGEWWENDFMRDVTHWMPLPAAPKECE